MILISLALIGLIAIAIATEPKSSNAEQQEFIPVPVRAED